ncbi:MAG: selenium cofactor biosynthesis protein YqeC [Dehalococcoidales bacterium]
MVKYTKVESFSSEDRASKRAASLKEAFSIHPGEIVSLVGGGGKTTLMFALAQELTSSGQSVITTTTTRIFEPSASDACLIVETSEKKMLNLLLHKLDSYRHITLASERLPSGKLKGISPGLVAALAGLVAYTIVEADGAARKPLKAPNATEPVIPQSTSLVIPVVGIDALGLKLTADNAFRPELISRLTRLPLGGIISADAIATLITHARGIIKGSPAHSRIVPLINKMDLARGLAEAENLASRILDKRHPRIERVVLGQLQSRPPVVEIIQAT